MDMPVDIIIDHVNGMKTDNRRLNLRFASKRQNAQNARLSKNNTSGAKGVHYHCRRNKYVASIKVDNRKIHLGYYTSVIEASEAYDRAAIKYFGEFARLNNLREKTPNPVSFLLPGKDKVQQTLDLVSR